MNYFWLFILSSQVCQPLFQVLSLTTSKFEWTLDNIRIEKIISAPILPAKFFLEVSALLAVRHCPKLQSWAISEKTNDGILRKWQKPYPNFKPNLGPKKLFSRVLSRQCSKLSSYAISWKTNELILGPILGHLALIWAPNFFCEFYLF